MANTESEVILYEFGLPPNPLTQYSGTNIEFGSLIKFIKKIKAHGKKL